MALLAEIETAAAWAAAMAARGTGSSGPGAFFARLISSAAASASGQPSGPAAAFQGSAAAAADAGGIAPLALEPRPADALFRAAVRSFHSQSYVAAPEVLLEKTMQPLRRVLERLRWLADGAYRRRLESFGALFFGAAGRPAAPLPPPPPPPGAPPPSTPTRSGGGSAAPAAPSAASAGTSSSSGGFGGASVFGPYASVGSVWTGTSPFFAAAPFGTPFAFPAPGPNAPAPTAAANAAAATAAAAGRPAVGAVEFAVASHVFSFVARDCGPEAAAAAAAGVGAGTAPGALTFEHFYRHVSRWLASLPPYRRRGAAFVAGSGGNASPSVASPLTGAAPPSASSDATAGLELFSDVLALWTVLLVQRLRAAMADTRVVVVTGVAGAGRTSLCQRLRALAASATVGSGVIVAGDGAVPAPTASLLLPPSLLAPVAPPPPLVRELADLSSPATEALLRSHMATACRGAAVVVVERPELALPTVVGRVRALAAAVAQLPGRAAVVAANKSDEALALGLGSGGDAAGPSTVAAAASLVAARRCVAAAAADAAAAVAIPGLTVRAVAVQPRAVAVRAAATAIGVAEGDVACALDEATTAFLREQLDLV